MNEIPEGRGSSPAGALVNGSPIQPSSDSTPGSAVPGRVVHCKRDGYDFYIGRPGKYGNPYTMKTEDDRERVIKLFEEYARARISRDRAWAVDVWKLYGKRLGCYCAPKPCHGDVLLKLAAEQRGSLDRTTKGVSNG